MDASVGLTIDEARAAYAHHDWATALAAFSALDADGVLGGDDLERLAWSARWSGSVDQCISVLERAEVAFADGGERTSAARMALEQARHHKQLLRESVAVTAYLRAIQYLEGEPESAEHAQALWSLSFTQLESGDADGARDSLEEARAIAMRVGDDGVHALVLQGLAHLAVFGGDVEEVHALVDEAASLAMRPNVSPVHAGHVYCAVISICRSLCDWRRASEWTAVSSSYCERESIAGYTGQCRFHQAELDRLHGHLARAEARVVEACDELLGINRYSAAWGFNELVEIRVRRGDLAGAEAALARAVELGGDGQPGRARLLLARGDVAGAIRSIDRSLGETDLLAREFRVFVLPVHVTACLAADAVEPAAESSAELDELAARLGTPAPRAAAAVARGELALHRGDRTAAIAELQAGVRAWCEIDAPYEAAEARLLLARALREDGDDSGADLERRAAAGALREIGGRSLLELATDPQAGPESRTDRAFLFSDIVESTRLSEAIGDEAWSQFLRWHDRVLRSIFARHAGEEVKHGGDGFFVAFADVGSAVACAVDVQRALAEHRAELGFSPEVRIGIHAGEATAREGDYFGSAVTRAARIAGAAGAREVLVSVDALGRCHEPVALVERRELRLKGIAGTVEAGLVDWSS